MKILILSANTGEGHNSSARALLMAMQARGIEAEMRDVLSVSNPNPEGSNASHAVSKTYVKSTEGFNLFSKVYALAQWVSENINHGKHSPIYWVNKIYWRKLSRVLDEGHYDAVVSCHLFAAESLTAVKREGKLHIPSFFVMTDYTFHAFLNDTDLDYYIIPHEDLVPLWVRQGIAYDRLFPIGIPVDTKKFTNRLPKDEARAQVMAQLRPEETLSEEVMHSHWYLVMSGSMGFGKMTQVLRLFAGRCGKHDRIICVCGRNQRALRSIQREFVIDKRIVPVGYTDKISLLMDTCDVVLSKPGGITTTETFIKNIPLVHTAPIPGIESENAEFCHEHGMSFYGKTPQEQVVAAIELAQNPERREKMLEEQRRNSEPKTCDFIVDLIEHTVKS